MVFIFSVVTKEFASEKFIASFEMMKTVPGFQSILLFQDQANKNKFTCIEYWDNKETHAQHVKEVTKEVRDAWLQLVEEVSSGQFFEKIIEIKP